jgi:hypothetical protein
MFVTRLFRVTYISYCLTVYKVSQGNALAVSWSMSLTYSGVQTSLSMHEVRQTLSVILECYVFKLGENYCLTKHIDVVMEENSKNDVETNSYVRWY